MTIDELKALVEAAAAADPVIGIEVSEAVWVKMQTEIPALAMAPHGQIPVIRNPFFRPEWWAERYRDRMLLHTPQGDRVIPNVVNAEVKFNYETIGW